MLKHDVASAPVVAKYPDLHIETGHGALLSSGHPVFPGFQGDGISCRIDRDGSCAATYAVSVLTLGDLTLFEYLERQSWAGLDHDKILLREGAEDLGRSMTGAVGFIGGLWVRPDKRKTPFSEWCKVDLPTIAMKECDRRYRLHGYFFFVREQRIGQAAMPDAMSGTVWWHRSTEDADVPPRYLGVISRASVLARPDPGSAPH